MMEGAGHDVDEMWNDPTEQFHLLERDKTIVARDDGDAYLSEGEYRLLGRREV